MIRVLTAMAQAGNQEFCKLMSHSVADPRDAPPMVFEGLKPEASPMCETPGWRAGT